MKSDFIEQFNHTWNLMQGLCQDFDEAAWFTIEHGYINPSRLAYHVLLSTLYYIEDTTEMVFASGRPLAGDWLTMERHLLPSKPDIDQIIPTFRTKTTQWLAEMDINAPNPTFPWAGQTRLGVVFFLQRHTLYHLGELNALLQESTNGHAKDNFIQAFN
ncbi:MAG: hypothetical protein P1S60_15255 [Anaerolineae bacterium]|nr:hypothetical protein [Anaerolineae bacterium]